MYFSLFISVLFSPICVFIHLLIYLFLLLLISLFFQHSFISTFIHFSYNHLFISMFPHPFIYIFISRYVNELGGFNIFVQLDWLTGPSLAQLQSQQNFGLGSAWLLVLFTLPKNQIFLLLPKVWAFKVLPKNYFLFKGQASQVLLGQIPKPCSQVTLASYTSPSVSPVFKKEVGCIFIEPFTSTSNYIPSFMHIHMLIVASYIVSIAAIKLYAYQQIW